MRLPWIPLALVAGTVIIGVAVYSLYRGRYEQPEYQVLERGDGWEIRRYAPSIEARTTIDAPFDEAVSEGFRRLAGFIFGDNVPREEIDMTTPVAAAADEEGWTVAFTMPSEHAWGSLPEPSDPRIRIVEVPERIVAARRFSGRVDMDRVERELERLSDELDASELELAGEGPVVAQYDPPIVPGFLRRNEVLIPLR